MIFRGYDIRGIYPKEINRRVATNIGKAFGTFLDSEDVVVGVDTRLTSQKIIKSFIDGIRSTGCEVFFLGSVPNPVAYYYAYSHKIFGAYVTASHNPPEYTGVKFIKPNGVSFTNKMKRIKEIYERKNFSEGFGRLTKVDGMKEYKEFLMKLFPSLNGKIAVESFGGVGELAVPLLKEIGLKVFSVRKKISVNFFGLRPEPKSKNLKKLQAYVKGKHFGVAFDGDADRSVFVTEKGKILNGSESAAIFLDNILKKKKGEVILTADCAAELESIVKKRKSKLVWWRVGHGFIEEKLVKDKALFAAEQSSHFYFNEDYPFSDGILATLYMAKILNGRKLSDVCKKYKINPIDKFYINANNDKLKLRVMNKVKKDFPDALNIMDGIKIKLNKKEWVLIRASQTMPEVNICLQARNKRRLNQLKKKYTAYVKATINQLKSAR